VSGCGDLSTQEHKVERWWVQVQDCAKRTGETESILGYGESPFHSQTELYKKKVNAYYSSVLITVHHDLLLSITKA
jgi:hypothetical protein